MFNTILLIVIVYNILLLLLLFVNKIVIYCFKIPYLCSLCFTSSSHLVICSYHSNINIPLKFVHVVEFGKFLKFTNSCKHVVGNKHKVYTLSTCYEHC